MVADSSWDRDAIEGSIYVKSAPFEGAFHTDLWSHDFTHLREKLHEVDQLIEDAIRGRRSLPATVEFRLTEATLYLTFTVNRGGLTTVHARARDSSLSDVVLSFSFSLWSSDLRHWMEAVDEGLKQFPRAW